MHIGRGTVTYEAIAQSAWERASEHLAGNPAGIVGVVSERTLLATAQSALESSARALGFGDAACFFCTLRSSDQQDYMGTDSSMQAEADKRAASSKAGAASTHNGESPVLSAADLFTVIESLDPIVLIATDSTAARTLSEAYRANIAPFARSRVFGRTTVAFRSFEDLLATPDDKQRAWRILKLLSS